MTTLLLQICCAIMIGAAIYMVSEGLKLARINRQLAQVTKQLYDVVVAATNSKESK